MKYIDKRDNKLKDIYAFEYIDAYHINSFYAQIFGDEKEITSRESSEYNIKKGIKGKIISIVGAEIATDERYYKSDTIKKDVTTINKAMKIIECLRSEDYYIQDIIMRNPTCNIPLFVGYVPFFLSNIYDKCTKQSLFMKKCDYDLSIEQILNSFVGERLQITINNNSVLVWDTGSTNFIRQIGLDYKSTNGFFEMTKCRSEPFGIEMHVPAVNLTSDANLLSYNEQLEKSYYQDYFVFGELQSRGNNLYYLKPYAIWR